MKKKSKEITYKKRDLVTIQEVAYSDGVILYDLEYTDENGFETSSGLFNEIDLFIELLVLMGKISRPKVFVSKSVTE